MGNWKVLSGKFLGRKNFATQSVITTDAKTLNVLKAPTMIIKNDIYQL